MKRWIKNTQASRAEFGARQPHPAMREYNQSLAEDNVLIEVGGVDNTLEESYRTADALAEVISEIYWEDEKAQLEVASARIK